MTKPPKKTALNNYPFISVLVAARNEADNIIACLQSLAKLDYPIEKIEILIGEDRSTDNTAALIQSFCQQHPYFRYIPITEDYLHLRGKQNVLAQLAKLANGEILLFTDADIVVSSQWAKILVSGFEKPTVGVVSAGTIVAGNSLFSGMQALDWLWGNALIAVFHKLGLRFTAVGNNMAVSRTAYNRIGGYENLPFSLTEDYLLYKHILNAGYTFKFFFGKLTLNLSQPIGSWKGYFNQRKRWWQGGKDGPWHALAIFGFHVFSGLMPIVGWLLVPLTYYIYGVVIKIGMDFIFLTIAAQKVRQLYVILFFLAYPIYFSLIILVLPLYFLMPTAVVWKSRTFR
jgi:cellulose synthase/poly-beta-1,6-N-acetylglucosamine synthase-like glycosyltransferase